MSRNLTKKRKTTPPLGSEDLTEEGESTTTTTTTVKRARGQVQTSNGGQDKQFYETKVLELEEDIRHIKSGDLPDLLEKLKQLEKKKKDELQKASLLRDLRRQEIETLYEFHVQEANDVFNGKKKELQDKMLFDVEEALKRMKELRDGAAKKKGGRGRSASIGGEDEESQEDDDAAAPHPSNPQSEETEEVSSQQAVGPKKARVAADRKMLSNPFDLNVQYSAAPDEIAQDLALIHSDWVKRVEAYHSKEELLNMSVYVEDGKLFFNEHIIEKGSNVVVHSEATKEELYGVVTKIAATEILIKLADNSNSRLLLAHLKSGRCKVAKDVTRETVGSSQ